MDTNQRVTGTGPIYFQYNTSIFIYLSINKSIGISTDRRKGQRDTSLWQHKSGRITWLIYQHRRGYPYWLTLIDGWAVSISNPRHQYSLIGWLTYQLIDLSTEGHIVQRNTSVGKQTAVLISQPIYQQRRGDSYQWTLIDRQSASISNPRHQYSFINNSINPLIDLSTDGWNLHRDTSVG